MANRKQHEAQDAQKACYADGGDNTFFHLKLEVNKRLRVERRAVFAEHDDRHDQEDHHAPLGGQTAAHQGPVGRLAFPFADAVEQEQDDHGDAQDPPLLHRQHQVVDPGIVHKALQEIQGRRDVRRTEEDPGEVDEQQRDAPADKRLDLAGMPRLAVAPRKQVLDQLSHAVDAAPQYERPVRAVPQAGDQERDQQVQPPPALPLAIAAERDVQVVAEPGGQRNVPATPEVADARRKIRRIEVLHQVEAEDLCRADRDHRVAAEVAVDLQRKRQRRQQQRHAAEGRVVVPDGVHEDRSPVGDDHLQEESPDHQDGALGHAFRVPQLLFVSVLYLGQQVFRTLDGSRHELREERHEQRVAQQVLLRLRVAAVHVDDVAQRLERVERDADGQQQVQRAGGADGRKDHVAVFEHGQDGQVEHDAEREDGAVFRRALGADGNAQVVWGLVGRAGQRQAAHVGRQRACGHQRGILDVPRHIKNVAAGQKPGYAQFLRYNKIHGAHGREEEHKLYRVELHLFLFER